LKNYSLIHKYRKTLSTSCQLGGPDLRNQINVDIQKSSIMRPRKHRQTQKRAGMFQNLLNPGGENKIANVILECLNKQLKT